MNNEKVPLQLQRISYTEEFILFQLHYNVVAMIYKIHNGKSNWPQLYVIITS